MKIQNKQDVYSVNDRFNHFHDGFIKKISVISGDEFVTEMPWEKKRKFKTNEEELLQTSLLYGDKTTIEMAICHIYYDWPNQPRNRVISIRINDALKIADNLLKFVGQEIFDLKFEIRRAVISCVLVYYKANSRRCVRTIKDGIKIVLFSSKNIEIKETLWTK